MLPWPRLLLALLLAPLSALADEAAQADAALNANYKALSAQLDGANQQRLRDAQRAWIAFRDKECLFRAQGGDGGTASALASSNCIGELSRQRADALKLQLECAEGDITCVPRNRAAAAPARADVACSQSAGQQKAQLLVQQCQQVSPATHPPCNVANACDLMIDEIRRSCAMIGTKAPAFCSSYAQ